MKELQVLAEDWVGEIDVSLAHVQIRNGGITILKDIVYDLKSTYYMMNPMGTELEEMKPEPRPADSIKLGECEGKHLIIAERNGLKYYSIGVNPDLWVFYCLAENRILRYSKDGKRNDDAAVYEFSDIRIFDMAAE